MKTIVKRIKSASRSAPGVEYETLLFSDGSTSCNCPGWTKRTDPVTGERDCRHCKDLRNGKNGVAAKAAVPVPAAAPRAWTNDRSGWAAPMLAEDLPKGLTPKNYEHRDWFMEPKYDGKRLTIVVRKHGQVAIWSRPSTANPDGLPQTLSPEAMRILASFPPGTYDAEGIPATSWYSNHGAGEVVIFDILRTDASGDLTKEPCSYRRTCLDKLAEALKAQRITTVTIAPWWPVSAKRIAQILADGGEGVILKRKAGKYRPGYRTADWLKVKAGGELVCTIVGFEQGSFGKCAVVKIRTPHGVETTTKTRDTVMRRMFEQNPKAFIGKQLRITHKGLHPESKKPRHPMCGDLIGGAR